MPSRFGVHCFLTTLSCTEFGIKPRGSGASLSATYALERALYELIQALLLMHGNYFDHAIDFRLFKNNYLLKKFFRLEISPIIYDSNELTAFHESHVQTTFLNTTDCLLKLIELVQAQSFDLLVNLIFQYKNGLSCTLIKIPGIEELCLTANYMPLNFTDQMRLYIEKQMGKPFNWNEYFKSKET